MRKYFFYIIFIVLVNFSVAQNLVVNPSFENFISCPNNLGQVDSLVSWRSIWPGSTPDFFNACGVGPAGVPYNSVAPKYAHSGGGMVGMVTYEHSFPGYREHIGAKLSDSLQTGQKYYISFYTSFAGTFTPTYQKLATNKLGILLTKNNVIGITFPNKAHLKVETILTDAVNWSKISGSFISDSAYKFINIGNFFTNASTDTLIFINPPNNGSAYYFIDDICISKDSLTCNSFVGIDNFSDVTHKIRIYPNPTSNTLHIETNQNEFENSEIEIINYIGQTVLKQPYSATIDVSELSKGFYTLKIVTTNKQVYFSKFLKQ